MRLFLIAFLFCVTVTAQKKYQGQVVDFDTSVPIAFAKITHEGAVWTADWEGRFEITITQEKKPVQFSYKGYFINNFYLPEKPGFLYIKLITDNSQHDAEVYSEQKVNDIIKTVIERKKYTNPDKALKSYEYRNYEKVIVSANPEAISSKIDTIVTKTIFGKTLYKPDSTNYKFKKFVEKQHIYQTEKVNLIQHNEKGNKETIIASRMAGFKQPLYEYLGLQLVSYSIYENPFTILEIPVHNPISNFGRKLYTYRLLDTLKVDNRTVYRVYFQPKKLKSSSLRGLLYVDAETYGIAKAFYKIYGLITINATYTFDYKSDTKIWFPKKRKFEVVKGENSQDLKIFGGTIRFDNIPGQRIKNDASDQTYVLIESTPYDFKFNTPTVINQPKIKIEVPHESLKQDEKFWSRFSRDSTDVRRLNTYTALDSLSESEKIEKKIFFGKKIINGYLPVSLLDIDLRSLIKFNNYEGFRLGLGVITNSKLSERYKLGAYIAYGLKDDKLKFGVTPSYQIDKKTNTWLNVSYVDDVSEIGQIQFATQNKRFRIYDPRPINVSTFYENKATAAWIESKYIPKTDVYLGVTRSEIVPLFEYLFLANDKVYSGFKVSTATVAVQWNPFSGYMQTPTGRIEIEKRYPKFSCQITQSVPGFFDSDLGFTKFDFRTEYDIPYLSGQKTSFVLQSGISNGEIPLTHLYSIAPNNLDRETLLKRITFAGKNSFETMYYNEFFSSDYFMLQVRHTFNKIKLGYKINPVVSVVSRTAFGSLKNPEQHELFYFKTLEKGFFESGIEVNKLIWGFGLNMFYRYGPNGLPRFEDNISLKISYHLDLGF